MKEEEIVKELDTILSTTDPDIIKINLILSIIRKYADWKIKELTYFLEHSRECILSQFEEGEPTENGGYRQKYAGKWYQTRPINNIPKCTCGLDQILSNKDKK